MMVARPARYDRVAFPPQAARRSGRLPAVKHGYALRAVSLRDDVPSSGLIYSAPVRYDKMTSPNLPSTQHSTAMANVNS